MKLWISTDERWITGSLLGCQRATLAPFTSALSGAKHQWQGLPTVNDSLQEDQKAVSPFGVTIDLQQPPIPMNYAPVISWGAHTKAFPIEIWIQTMEVIGSMRMTGHSRALTTGK